MQPCNLQGVIRGMGPEAWAFNLLEMKPVDLLFSGHTLPGFGENDMDQTPIQVLVKRLDMPPINEMVDKAMECFDALKEFGATIDMEKVEADCMAAYQHVLGVYGEDVWSDDIGGNSAYIAKYFVGMGKRLKLCSFRKIHSPRSAFSRRLPVQEQRAEDDAKCSVM
ncbi:hypothetical protein BJ508DRAFT_325784 [Ascobolus immersus RN42]|uniref:Uncharacterized protein n=1 Tax=Ascobolus immersus RN42 TaxID=1160509 RepID=A0A3N4I841_ASCIM|nr:hypothetical protein BJ508DRAFT_325784 [Ascobolus immersus RN42]